MKTLKRTESIMSFFDFGAVLESLKNYREKGLEMDLKEFLKILIFGEGYKEITPPQLSDKMSVKDSSIAIIDLREEKSFMENGIKGAFSDPFDDLLRGVLVEDKYSDRHDQEIVLICDTGQKSKVAASMLAEEGFKKVKSLKGGMRRWQKWQKLLLNCDRYCHLSFSTNHNL